MISDEKQYEFITKRISDLSNATEDGIKLFIPMFSAILGGSIWLRFQIKDPLPVPPSYEYLSNVLMVLLTCVCVYIVLDNLRAWWGYRKELAMITKKTKFPAAAPTILPSALLEMVLIAAMTTACVIFVKNNPFIT